jgi:hypothetical protein
MSGGGTMRRGEPEEMTDREAEDLRGIGWPLQPMPDRGGHFQFIQAVIADPHFRAGSQAKTATALRGIKSGATSAQRPLRGPVKVIQRLHDGNPLPNGQIIAKVLDLKKCL